MGRICNVLLAIALTLALAGLRRDGSNDLAGAV